MNTKKFKNPIIADSIRLSQGQEINNISVDSGTTDNNSLWTSEAVSQFLTNQLGDYYTKSEVYTSGQTDSAISTSLSDYYTQTQIDNFNFLSGTSLIGLQENDGLLFDGTNWTNVETIDLSDDFLLSGETDARYVFVTGDTMTGDLFIDSLTNSTTWETGALIVSGGVGIGGDINTNGSIKLEIGESVNNISMDSGMTGDNNSLWTTNAIQDYVLENAGGGVDIESEDRQIIFNSGGTLTGSSNYLIDEVEIIHRPSTNPVISASTLTIDANNKRAVRCFPYLDISTRTINTNFTISLSNVGNIEDIYMIFKFTGTIDITFPVGTLSIEDVLGADMIWNSSSRVLTIGAGTDQIYEISMVKDIEGSYLMKAVGGY